MAAALAAPGAYAQETQVAQLGDLGKLSIEQLANMDITSVSKSAQPLSQAAASIYVITADDVHRSGAANIPEMLRLAPNLMVAQFSSTGYAVSARGFNVGQLADKLLVLVDGRTVYNPLFAGVYWDTLNVPAVDIERIEVISGPGGTLWGANAVNGVINIITRKSSDSQGTTIVAGAGGLKQGGLAQYGGAAGTNGTYRVYATGDNFNHFPEDGKNPVIPSLAATGHDAAYRGQTGFRSDWKLPGGDGLTVQGDAYQMREQDEDNSNPFLSNYMSGSNLLSRWNHDSGALGSFQLQAYYDNVHRYTTDGGGGLSVQTFDIELQDNLALGERNQLVWGAGDRLAAYSIQNLSNLKFEPFRGNLYLGNVFVEDTYALTDSFKLIAGIKAEDDPYVGWTPMPSLRAAWNASPTQLVWAAISKVDRSPTPLDRSIQEFLPGGAAPAIAGSGNFNSEQLVAYEIGYRAQPLDQLSVSVTGFWDSYSRLEDLSINPNTLFPLVFANDMKGEVHGFEAWATYSVTGWWRLSAGAELQHETLVPAAQHSAVPAINNFMVTFQPNQVASAGNDATHQEMLRSSFDLSHTVSFDLDLREVGSLPNPKVAGYVELNSRVGWHVTPDLELSLAGYNLLHAYHQEFATNGTTAEIPRSFYGEVVWHF